MENSLLTTLTSLAAPYVHYCKTNNPGSVASHIRRNCIDTKIVEIDGRCIRRLEQMADVLNRELGLSFFSERNIGDELFWTRFDDLVATDFVFDDHRGCVIIVGNAEHALEAAGDGLLRFGSSMNKAGEGYANPVRYIQVSRPCDDVQPRPVHTIFCYKKIPKNAPNANQIKL